MKQHKYYNTIWDERDREFYWDGIKNGMIIGMISAIALVVGGIRLVEKVKELNK